MSKKVAILTACLSIFFSLTYGQEVPFYQHYIFDQTLLNPALGARYDYISIKLTGAEKWRQLPENPQTQTFSYNMKFETMGFNVSLLNDMYGVIGNSAISASYFYYIILNTHKDFVSFGVSGSLKQMRIGLPVADEYSKDPAIFRGNITSFYPNTAVGVYYKSGKVSLGFSATNLVPYKHKALLGKNEPKNTRTYFFYSEFIFDDKKSTFAFIPSAMYALNEKLQMEININTKFVILNRYWCGLSYKDAFMLNKYSIHNAMAMVGFRFFKRLNIAYGYELNVGSYSASGGTHLVMLGFDFVKIKRKKIPQFYY